MIAIIAFCLLSQDVKAEDVKAFVEKAEGTSKTEKALNGVEEVCKQVFAHIQDSNLSKDSDKKLVEKSYQDLKKDFETARKDKKPESYSNAIGKMSFYFRVMVRNVPGQKYSGMKAEALRNACFEVMDDARIIMPKDLINFIEQAKGNDQTEKTLKGIAAFCDAIRVDVTNNEKLTIYQQEHFINAWNSYANSHLDALKGLTKEKYDVLIKNNKNYFEAINNCTKNGNIYGNNWKILHSACLIYFKEIEPK